MRAVDLFCGAGGFSVGAHWAGLDVVRAFDMDPVLTHSFRTNFPSTELVLADLSTVSGKDIKRAAGGVVDVVLGGPPCQGFSVMGRRRIDDPRRTLLYHFFRIVNEIRPSAFVMENVVGLTHENSRSLLDRALGIVADKYQLIGPVILNAADYGAATARQRVFVVGIDTDYCGLPNVEKLDGCRPASVRDAIADLPSAELVEANVNGLDYWRLSNFPPPSKYAESLRSADLTFTGNRSTVHSQKVIERFKAVKPGATDPVGRHARLSWEGLCPTLRAGTGSDRGAYQSVRPIHPTEPRVITVREAARLQGFPDGHQFHPTIWHSFRMIGNSVCPIMARTLLTSLRDCFDAARPSSGRGLEDVG